MKKFILINFASQAKLVHIYGIIVAESPEAAAHSVGSQIITKRNNEGGSLGDRYYLKESKWHNDWFLEEIKVVTSRPEEMNRRDI